MRTPSRREQNHAGLLAAATEAWNTIFQRNAFPAETQKPVDSPPATCDSESRPSCEEPASAPAVPDAKPPSLRQRFIARTREDYAALLLYRRSDGLPTLRMIPIVHRLAGTAGMIGFAAISTIAGRLDDELAEGNTQRDDTLRELLTILEKTISPEAG